MGRKNKNKDNKKKTVIFSHIITVHTLTDSCEERREMWMQLAVDAYRFKCRVERLVPILSRVLSTEHRKNICAINEI